MNNDLISRSALKKEVENLVAGGAEGLKDYYENGSKSDENSWIGGVYDAWDLVCNAPTVEERSYAMGYQDGAEDGLQGIRTEGKWIYHRAQGEFLPYMECDNCHEEFLLNMLRPAEFRKVNRFCSYCGADMRGNK